MSAARRVLAISGGVGGAKLAFGLAALLDPAELLIVANTGDDFEHLGLPICPDIDTLIYTLAGLADPLRGWGLAGETWQCMGALGTLGGPDWFRLGDRDLATHLQRGALLRAGLSLSEQDRVLTQYRQQEFAIGLDLADQGQILFAAHGSFPGTSFCSSAISIASLPRPVPVFILIRCGIEATATCEAPKSTTTASRRSSA